MITVTGVGGATVSKELLLIVRDNVANINTIAPVDGASQIGITGTNLTWNPDSQATEYIVDISTDAGFNTIIETGITPNTYYTIGTTLSLSTVYYWRVKASNNCNISDYSSTKNFITLVLNDCTRPPDSNITITPINSEATASSVTNVPDDLTISKINVTVNITHTWIQDLDITLISPNGTRSILFKNGCTSEDGLEVIFDNFTSQTISDICGTEPVTGTIKPTESLSIFNNESTIGDWYLEVHDGYSGDEGSINSWSLEFCHAQVITNSSLTNATIVVGANTTYVLQQSETEATSSGSTAIEQVFMLSELPTEGDVRLNNTPLMLGDIFTQNDINTGVLTYVNTSSINTLDFFKVDITNATGGFLSNQQINITIDAALAIDNYFFEKTGISVYPTVSDGSFIISSSKTVEKTSIELYSITGQKVFSQELNFSSGNIEHINAQQLASGVYILKLTSENLQESKKIIIK